jgi:hypothetical protein
VEVTGLNNFFNPQRLNSWTAYWMALKFLKSPLMSNSVSKIISRCSKVGWEDWARELEAWDVEGMVLGILEVGQDFCRAGDVQPLNQFVKTKPYSCPTPCKNSNNQQQRTTTLCMSKV